MLLAAAPETSRGTPRGPGLHWSVYSQCRASVSSASQVILWIWVSQSPEIDAAFWVASQGRSLMTSGGIHDEDSSDHALVT
jgi:hypothetical protein